MATGFYGESYLASKTSGSKTSGSTNTVKNLKVALQNGTDRLVYATWTWPKKHTDHYRVVWRYYTGNNVGFIGSESDEAGSTSGSVRATYTAPSNAVRVMCTVTPVAKTYTKKKNKKTVTVSYWKATAKSATYGFKNDTTPAVPSVPSVSISAPNTIKAELSVTDANTKQVEFEVVYDGVKRYKIGTAGVSKQYTSHIWGIVTGHTYRVRARGVYNSKIKSAWSDYSSEVKTTPPAPKKFISHNITNENTIYLEWAASNGATGYTVEYTTSKNFFDRVSSISSVSVSINSAFIQQLDTGTTWWFRVKATNDQGSSGWSPLYSVVLGVPPTAPTTWTETATGVVGDTVHFYWMHNAEDGSSQTNAQVEIAVGDGAWERVTPTYISTNEGEASYLTYQTFLTTSENLIDSLGANVLDSDGNIVSTEVYTSYAEGTVIRWRVRTKGVVGSSEPEADYGFSPWSTERSLTLYGRPSVGLVVTDDETSDTGVDSFSSFPIYVKATANPAVQNAISWNISVVANESYTAYDETGIEVAVSAGNEIYSEHISGNGENTLVYIFDASNIDFETNISYTITVRVAMSSGMTAESSQDILIDWTASELWPNAEVSVDSELLCAYIRPFCTDDEDNYIENVTLSVYRRDYDGRFTKLITDVPNTGETVFTDPHPSLDFARYRVVAKSTATGQIGYYDLPGEEVGETAIIIQWDEAWSSFNVPSGDGDGLADSAWAGSVVKLPFNIKVSETTAIDKNLVEYIGRSAPVSYYGTQLGVSGSWSSEFPATDIDTRYALRRLQAWPGDAYVREPNGVGYWASVEVSFNKDYNNLLIPVTINVTRVEGGI